MKKLLILGAGTAGTIMVNKLAPVLDQSEWQITIVDHHETHYYQPGFLFIPFGIYTKKDVIKPKRDFFPTGVEVIFSGIDIIEPEKNQVKLTDGKVLSYDYLVIATGSQIKPEETEGLVGDGWRKNIFDFYTIDGACALAHFLKYWEGGRMVLNVVEMPIKCPVAPLEFEYLAEWWLTEQGLRDKVEIEFVTPLPGAFTKPKASQLFGDFLDKKNIKLTPEFSTGRVDAANNKIISWDEQDIAYDLLVTVPTNMGDDAIARSGLGDELNFIPTDKETLQSKAHENIFVIGDATDLPSSKAGSVAHFQADILYENLLSAMEGRPLRAQFDGHANCYIESGFGKGILIDFNYDTEPLPGKFPLPGIGPFSLLEETKMNHYGKMMFRWMYWNLLLKGAELPIESQMMMAGKRV
ncbi:MAG: NAD(P)/FAD-dependent oxidoreductase [Fidelibacterota bacterium]|nr:MAG: NAD(P)/FAD-dependent oxidoreductase [Candidatus Neomarinimicrobiota bacterium]